ncbi:MAG: O-acetylhomoserine aminocarboxypropyltransferase/cysteine synthase [SAR324 cluster bacterium]|nr:O-acetylhomoserine aminocarboxypropyltransferase/cysteine synthase [SAR324 cluster bacterium]MBL7034237.1 O-acetylhomoserine aminocarboxypropyltransferase/cysteine synthase [SAR324 cluster bacterium]
MTETQLSPEVLAFVKRGEQMQASASASRKTMQKKKFDTIAVHGIYNMEAALANQGSILEPAYLSPAQHFENSDHMEAALAYLMPAWAYSRIANPTIGYLEETLALLEGYGYPGETSACVTASGMSAIFMATNPFLSGSGPKNIVASAKCYGGTFMLFQERFANERGVEVRWVSNPQDLEEWEKYIDKNTRFVFGEMPSNPGLSMMDIEGVAKLAHQKAGMSGAECPLIIDSTVATPALMRPLCLGADIVVHSLSKSITSSGMAIAGALIARHNLSTKIGPDELRENFALYVKLLPFRDHGPSLSPFSALMILNDLRTLRSRMDFFSKNTMIVAKFLAAQPQVEDVRYPGLENFSGYELATKTMWLVDGEDAASVKDKKPVNRYGHMLGFTVKGGAKQTRKVFDAFRMIWRATDLGRVKSVATIPAISTHQQQGDAGRELAQVPENLIRLCVGGEHPDDVIADLEQALQA